MPSPRVARWLLRAVVSVMIAATFAIAIGLLWYVALVPNRETTLDRTADGIVVLTGGAERIEDALSLLANGRGRRLLITGVNRTTRPDEIANLIPKYHAMFACCVDLDHSAINTIGNAVEARRWARERGFRSLIVVTSAYHMPRAIVELAHQLPDVTLIGYPVVADRAEPWWSTLASAKRIILEYVKYIAALVRVRLDTTFPAAAIASPRSGAGA